MKLQEADVAERRETGSWKWRLREMRIGGKIGAGEDYGVSGSRLVPSLCYVDIMFHNHSDGHDRKTRQHDRIRKDCLQRMALTTLFGTGSRGEKFIR